MKGMKGSPEVRYQAQTATSDNGCIVWQGALVRGYAQFQVNGRLVYVHRWAWERANGPVPAGFQLDHLCRNRACSNPDHLEPVTPRENVLRGRSFAPLNARKTHCPTGHAYTPENTYTNPKGSRVCRTCKTARDRARRQDQKVYRLRSVA